MKMRMSFIGFYRNQDTRQSTYQELLDRLKPTIQSWRPMTALRLGKQGFEHSLATMEYFVGPVENKRFYM